MAYWKVDWGARGGDIGYRRLMNELRDDLAPDLVIEQHGPSGLPLNGFSLGKGTSAGGSGRLAGDEAFEREGRARVAETLAFADVFRLGDSITPIDTATDLERAVVYGQIAERVGSRALVNVGDSVYIAACLGHAAGVMRSPVWPEPDVADPVCRRDRTAEVTRAIAWQREAPAFTAASGLKTRASGAVLTDRWLFAPGSTWWSPALGRTIEQRAPAVVARGLPLPKVTPLAGEVPFVLASRHPNGALAVGALPRLTMEKGFHMPPSTVELDAELTPGAPLAVFGTFASVTVRVCAAIGRRVRVGDLADGAMRDVTRNCRYDGRRLTIDGQAIRCWPLAPGDRSLPGVRIELV